MRIKLSDHFYEDEFACRCKERNDVPFCDGTIPGGMDGELIQLLEAIREQCGGVKVTVNSGYRCPQYNDLPKKLGGVGGAKSSQHKCATAADIRVKGKTPKEVAAIAEKLMPKKGGIGVYPTFTHVDVRRNRARW